MFLVLLDLLHVSCLVKCLDVTGSRIVLFILIRRHLRCLLLSLSLSFLYLLVKRHDVT